MGGMGGMDYPQLEFSLSATASGRPCGSVVSNFEQLSRTAHVILLYTLFEADAALARGSVLQLEFCRFRYLFY